MLALCMIVMVFPTTAMAEPIKTSGPDAEKKVITNDLILQFPASADDMVDRMPTDMVGSVSDPKWDENEGVFFKTFSLKLWNAMTVLVE